MALKSHYYEIIQIQIHVPFATGSIRLDKGIYTCAFIMNLKKDLSEMIRKARRQPFI